MTSLAGVVGPRFQSTFEPRVRAALDAQSLYSRAPPRISVCADAAFALSGMDEPLPVSGHENSRWLFVGDARIDNREELIESLGDDGAPADRGDNALLFAAWLRWEERALDRLVGDFAFAAYDKDRRVLFLVRDPTGQRPLYYCVVRGASAFASMPSGLFQLAGCRADLARLALALRHRGFDDERSFFVGIKRVRPGHVVRIHREGVTSRPYWLPNLNPLQLDWDELVGRCRGLIDAAVGARLHTRSTDEPIACHLSSGLDSSAVTATAARLVDRSRLIAFTSAPIDGGRSLGPFQRPTDESPEAAGTAAELGIAHRIIRDATPLLDVLTDHTRTFQEPVRNVLNMGWWNAINRDCAALGAHVQLTAELGNAAINAGSIGSLADYVKGRRLRAWLRESRALMHSKGVSWRGVAMGSFSQFLPSSWIVSLERVLDKQASWSITYVRPEMIAANEGDPSIPKDQAKARLWALGASDPGALRKGTLGRYGVDQLDPMSDRRLTEFGLRLPPDAFLRGGEYSPLARAAIADRVPRHVLALQYRGFQGGDWPLRLTRSAAADAIDAIATSAGASELLDIAKLKDVIDRWPVAVSSSNSDLVFGRDFTAAIAAGRFVLDTEAEGDRLGRH